MFISLSSLNNEWGEIINSVNAFFRTITILGEKNRLK